MKDTYNLLPLPYITMKKYNIFMLLGDDKARMAPNHETYLISASSEEERNDWLKVMTKIMFANKGGGNTNRISLRLMVT